MKSGFKSIIHVDDRALLLICLVLPLSLIQPTAAQSAPQGGTQQVEIGEIKEAPLPYWYTTTNPREIAYGIQYELVNSGNKPYVVITGSNGTSKEFYLERAGTMGLHYEVRSAAVIGNIGIPTKVHLKSTGNDGVEWENMKIDLFVGKGWNTLLWTKTVDPINNRDTVLSNGDGTRKGQDALITTIRFDPYLGGVDGDTEAGIYGTHLTKEMDLVAEGLPASKSGGYKTESLDVGSKWIIIDARHSSQPIIWDSREEQTVSGEQILKAVRARDIEAGESMKLATSFEEKASVGDPAGLNKAEFTFKQSMEVTASLKVTKKRTDEESGQFGSRASDTDSRKYTILPGDVAFFELKKTANVTSYSDFSLFKRVSPATHVDINLTETVFRTDAASGELRLVNHRFVERDKDGIHHMLDDETFGDFLNSQAQKKFLDAAKAAWPGFSTKM